MVQKKQCSAWPKEECVKGGFPEQILSQVLKGEVFLRQIRDSEKVF